MGKDPRSITWDKIKKFSKSSFVQEYKIRLDAAKRDIELGNLKIELISAISKDGQKAGVFA